MKCFCGNHLNKNNLIRNLSSYSNDLENDNLFRKLWMNMVLTEKLSEDNLLNKEKFIFLFLYSFFFVTIN